MFRYSGLVRLLLIILALPLTTSCSLVLPADAIQCEVAEDCVARGFPATALCEQQLCVEPPFDPFWGCVGNVEEPVVIPGETYTVAFRLTNALTNIPPPELTARLCAAVDLNCSTPLQEGLTIGPDGLLQFTVTAGFQGYLETDARGLMPAIVPFGPVVADSNESGDALGLTPGFVVEALANAADIEVDPATGVLLSVLTACDGIGHSGISTAYVPATGVPFYLLNLSPDQMTTSTDESGQAGVLNIEPGSVTITSTREETGDALGELRVPIRAGTITYAAVVPSPT